jgi:serine/threonine protein kinase
LSAKSIGVQEGDILAGKYRVDRVLGAGGMGVVVAAHHLGLDNKVAIKFLLPEMLGQGDAVARFAREAKAAVKISNEHVARVLDVGALESGAPYMVMEYLDGSDLHQLLERHGAMPIAQAVDFLLQACEAIAEAHGLGIVHRDLKPANLFCIRKADGTLCIKVLDFGISKMTSVGMSGSNVSMTRTTAMMGTPLYMSPEQMESSRSVDLRSDIWALGIILFELLTGRLPFDGETLPEVCIKIATQPPPPIRTVRPEVSPALEAALLRCLEKDRGRRFQNVAELSAALAPHGTVQAGLSAERVRRTLQGATTTGPAPRPEDRPSDDVRAPPHESIVALGNTKRERPRKGPGTGAIAGIAVGATVLVGVLAFAFLSRGGSPAGAAASSMASGAAVGSVALPPTAPPAATSAWTAPGAEAATAPAASVALAPSPAPSSVSRDPSESLAHPDKESSSAKGHRAHGPVAAPPARSTPPPQVQAAAPSPAPQPAAPAPPPARPAETKANAYDERL